MVYFLFYISIGQSEGNSFICSWNRKVESAQLCTHVQQSRAWTIRKHNEIDCNFFHFYGVWVYSANHSTYKYEFLEYLDTPKSLCGIWQRFSCLLDMGILKIYIRNLILLVAFWASSKIGLPLAHLDATFCPVLVCPQMLQKLLGVF